MARVGPIGVRSPRPAVLLGLAVALGRVASAHDGPPYPIVSERSIGPYVISVWTDPDTTDDGSPGGQFWVLLQPAASSTELPSDTRAHVTVAPLDRKGPELTARADPIRGDVSRQFAAVLLDHEGRFRVRVTLEGGLGPAEVESEVEATYDLRPPAYMLAVYLVPFLLVGFLWLKLLLKRRGSRGR